MENLFLMDEAIRFLLHHGYIVLFLIVFAEQIGLPIPAVPVLLAAGALSGSGRFSLAVALPLAVLACLIADLSWYELGRRRGRAIVKLLCRISLEPDFCVRRTADAFSRFGARVLLFAKFVPGLSLVAPPLAAMFRMRILPFLAWDAAGSLLWAGGFIGAGVLFRDRIERVGVFAPWIRSGVFVGSMGLLALYIIWKYANRRRFLRRLRIAHIGPKELRRRMEAGEELTVVDLRHPLEYDSDRVKIPGALHMLPEELGARHTEIPRDRDVVLYCTCPNEATSAMMALRLHRLGITRVRPLSGGFDAWLTGGFPLESKPAAPGVFDSPPG
ncbi:MAG: DedA family protein/thiosulfate sulfurtransferase GlpE [Deltaproteobacteria bacterium]